MAFNVILDSLAQTILIREPFSPEFLRSSIRGRRQELVRRFSRNANRLAQGGVLGALALSSYCGLNVAVRIISYCAVGP